jgi:hypothetical protein
MNKYNQHQPPAKEQDGSWLPAYLPSPALMCRNRPMTSLSQSTHDKPEIVISICQADKQARPIAAKMRSDKQARPIAAKMR